MKKTFLTRQNNYSLQILTLFLGLLMGCRSPVADTTPKATEAMVDKCQSAAKIVTCLHGVCNPATGDCVDCLSAADCHEADKPVCSGNVCHACSQEFPCVSGNCSEDGRCLECLDDADCTSPQKGLCFNGHCQPCSRANCDKSCDALSGKCLPPNVLPCPGGTCGEPSPITDIDPSTIALVEQLNLFVIGIPNLRAEEKPLEVATYSVEARVNGLFARVVTEFTVFNPNARVFEGELEFPLPDDAVVSGYAIDVGGVLTEAQVVEKQKARIAFENEVKKGIDPGLAEQVKGNMYRTRIYPIPANGMRMVRVEYLTPLTIAPNGDAALALPMPKTKLKKRDVLITVAASGVPAPVVGGLGDQRFLAAEAVWRLETHDTDITPEANILMALPHLPDKVVSAEIDRGEIFFVASIKTGEEGVSANNAALPNKWRLIWDASGSRTAQDIAKARRLVDELPERASYELHVFRNELEEPRTFASLAELKSALDGLAYDGGTSFAPLTALAAQKFAGPTLIFSDGLDTMEGALPEFGAKAVALVSGAIHDVGALRRIAGGRLVNLDILSPAEAMRQVLVSPPVVAALNGQGISAVQGIGLSAVGRVTVLGRLQNPGARGELNISDGRKIELQFPASGIPAGKTLATAWAAKRVEELSQRAEDNREELLALGRRFSLVSPVSSMIVFESLSQWLEYDIEPPESLATMHEEWLRQRPSEAQRAQMAEKRAQDWQKQLLAAWQGRIAWWMSPIPPKTEWKKVEDGAAEGGRRSISGERNSSAMRRESVAMRAPAAGATLEGEMAAPASEAGAMAQSSNAATNERAAEVSMTVRAWDPKTPYLQAIKDAKLVFKTSEALYSEYLRQRAKYAASPAFFLDCAGLFFKEHEERLAVRILSNLSEMKIDDPALLRVYAWRLREAGALDAAITVLNKVAKLRADEAVSWRDLALTLTMRAKKNKSAADTQKALEYFHKTVFTPWARNDALWTALVALEEFNELMAWSARQKWPNEAPVVPLTEGQFIKLLDTDMRIVMMWDADSTDIDMHVKEPSGEEVYYKHQRSKTGGLVSHDVTTGYGPEEFLHKIAPKGRYDVFTKYFASHQQNLIGPATITLMMYTNWGRENQQSEIVSLRLEKAKDKVIVGSFTVK